MIKTLYDSKRANVPGLKNAFDHVRRLYGPVEPYVAMLRGEISVTEFNNYISGS
jgi:hypothetical protein